MKTKTIITNLSPGELLKVALDNARRASDAIDELMSSPLDPGETLTDRAMLTAAHARVLSEAFSIVDSLMQAEAEAEIAQSCDCPACSPRPERAPDAPVPPHMN
jgi:hypothetical protein